MYKSEWSMHTDYMIELYYDQYLQNRRIYNYLVKNQMGGANTLNIIIQHKFVDRIVDYYVDTNIDIKDYNNMIIDHLKNKKIERMEDEQQINTTKPLEIFNLHIIKIEFDQSVPEDVEVNVDVNFDIIHKYIIDGILYIHLYNSKIVDEISLNINLKNDEYNIRKVYVYTTSYKNGDSYVLGPTKPLQHIFQIIQQQYHNRIQVEDLISTVRLNEITAEKLDYHQYLIDMKLIPTGTTQVFKRNVTENYVEDPRPKFKNSVIKYPFSSTSKCVFLPEKKIVAKSSCHMDYGYIVQKYNSVIAENELKTHVVLGKELYTMVRYKLSSYHNARNLKSKNSNIQKILDRYANEIPDILADVFDAINRLRYIKEIRNNHEMRRVYRLVKALVEPYDIGDLSFIEEYNLKQLNKKLDNLYRNKKLPHYIIEFLKPFTNDDYICFFDAMFTSLLSSYKLDRLIELRKKINDNQIIKMVDKLIHLYRMTDYEFDQIHLKSIDHPIKDYYMRIDIAPSDDKNYPKCYLNEIEPLASGKGEYEKIKEIFGDDMSTMGPTAFILFNTYREAIIKGYIEFEDVEFRVDM